MKIFTIGFTKTTAEHFFSRLREAGVSKVVDVRLNNASQLAGFAKRSDLPYFLQTICDIGYEHRPELAPTADILDAYKKQKGEWSEYERKFLSLMEQRRIEDAISPDTVDGACLLCSEDTPHYCHRRLVVEYLQGKWGNIDVAHL